MDFFSVEWSCLANLVLRLEQKMKLKLRTVGEKCRSLYGLADFSSELTKINPCSTQAALKAAKQTKHGRDEELIALRQEVEVFLLNFVGHLFQNLCIIKQLKLVAVN